MDTINDEINRFILFSFSKHRSKKYKQEGSRYNTKIIVEWIE